MWGITFYVNEYVGRTTFFPKLQEGKQKMIVKSITKGSGTIKFARRGWKQVQKLCLRGCVGVQKARLVMWKGEDVRELAFQDKESR